ncbi:MAG: hypothetical protein OXR66_05085 [Candidatus Woesearchaeota archaeon]|nr:hypothetical protein [Candidatus Woesearchaeota archaeon]
MKWTLLLLMLVLVSDVTAVSIGVNRASLTFTDILRGGYANESIMVVTDSTENISGSILLYGDEASWLSFSAETFTFSASQPYRLNVIAQPPPDARIENYRVNMSILTGELSRSEGGLLGTSTRASLGVPVHMQLTGTEILQCAVGGIKVKDTEREQQLEVEVSVINKGNVRVRPIVEVIVYDKFQTDEIARDTRQFRNDILPTLTNEEAVFYTFELPRDQYWATISVPECTGGGLYTFDVLEAGEVKDEGEFIQIDAPSWSEVGDIIPINAIFRNRGYRSVRAAFKGTIVNIDSEKIAKVIDTEQYTVAPDATAEIETFFNPTEPGRYMVTGKVFYNDKLTPERTFVLNVTGEKRETGGYGNYILYFLLLVIILFLILIIRRKKQRQHYVRR